MNARDAILYRIQNALAGDAPRSLPAVPEVWPRENPPTGVMAARFAEELAAVHGETIRAANVEAAQLALREFLDGLESGGADTSDRPPPPSPSPTSPAPKASLCIGAIDRPLCRAVAAGLPAERLAWVTEAWTPHQIAQLPLGLVAADGLVADTGSCLIAAATPTERLMCYLPPVCVVVARTDQLFEHLPAVWPEVCGLAADPERRGELVLITGPSRTADIEKILILGAHGPKRLVVVLVGEEGGRATK
jgi:L-lactate dehydrogenase complex protein LldG